MDLKALAKVGAKARIKELEEELAELRKFVKAEAPAAAPKKTRKRRKMTKEQRKAAAERMKAYWAKKKKSS